MNANKLQNELIEVRRKISNETSQNEISKLIQRRDFLIAELKKIEVKKEFDFDEYRNMMLY